MEWGANTRTRMREEMFERMVGYITESSYGRKGRTNTLKWERRKVKNMLRQ